MARQAVIGLIGGMSWESSAEYYRIINREVRNRLGGVHSARSLMWSVDFGEIEHLQHQGDWDELTRRDDRCGEPAGTRRGGLCRALHQHHAPDGGRHRRGGPASRCSTSPIRPPRKSRPRDFRKVGLLGTAFTMEQDFYKGRLEKLFGLEVLVPDADDRRVVHDIIYKELVAGQVSRGIADGLSRDYRPAGCARRAGDHPGLHGDHAAGVGGGQCRPPVRYHHPPRPCRGRPRLGLSRVPDRR